jgi:hypothetical protein
MEKGSTQPSLEEPIKKETLAVSYDFTVNPTNKGGVPDLRDGVYAFAVDEIKPAAGGDSKYDKGLPRAEFVLALDEVDEDGDAIIIRDWVTVYPRPTPKSKLFQLFSAVLFNGEKLPENGGVSASQLLGKRGRLIWGTKEHSESKGVIGYLPAEPKK